MYKLVFTDKEIEERKNKPGSTLSIDDRLKFEKEFNLEQLNLPKEHLSIYYMNPHIRQVFVNGREFIRHDDKFDDSLRIVKFEQPPSKYERRSGEVKTVEHWGQRKLLISEIEFLTKYVDSSNKRTVLYIGASPGLHIDYLVDLFPTVNQWILYDPEPLEIFPFKDKVCIFNEVFTDKHAEQYSNRDDILFISDIRTMDTYMDNDSREKRIENDMTNQMKWHLIIKPIASMLKFRLPYYEGKTEYLKGELRYQVWSGRTSSETRLHVTGDEKIEYDHTMYSDIMYHFNTVIRTTYYDSLCDISNHGLDHCYDCTAEIYILENYLLKYNKISKDDDDVKVFKVIDRMSKTISQKCSMSNRTLDIIKKQNRMNKKRKVR